MTPSEKREMGNRIRQARIKKGLRQNQCLKGLGDITPQMLSGWENGNVTPSINYLMKISEFFNVTIDYLITGKTESGESGDVLTYKDAILKMMALTQRGLFRLNANLFDASGHTSLTSFDETIRQFADEFESLSLARKTMRDDLFNEALKDLINKYDMPIKQS